MLIEIEQRSRASDVLIYIYMFGLTSIRQWTSEYWTARVRVFDLSSTYKSMYKYHHIQLETMETFYTISRLLWEFPAAETITWALIDSSHTPSVHTFLRVWPLFCFNTILQRLGSDRSKKYYAIFSKLPGVYNWLDISKNEKPKTPSWDHSS